VNQLDGTAFESILVLSADVNSCAEFDCNILVLPWNQRFKEEKVGKTVS
jgi:hypothetical protein